MYKFILHTVRQTINVTHQQVYLEKQNLQTKKYLAEGPNEVHLLQVWNLIFSELKNAVVHHTIFKDGTHVHFVEYHMKVVPSE